MEEVEVEEQHVDEVLVFELLADVQDGRRGGRACTRV